jgi:hypothetical protein
MHSTLFHIVQRRVDGGFALHFARQLWRGTVRAEGGFEDIIRSDQAGRHPGVRKTLDRDSQECQRMAEPQTGHADLLVIIPITLFALQLFAAFLAAAAER